MDKQEKMQEVGELFAMFHELHARYSRLWLEHTFLHWDWWISVGLSLSAWIFWFFYRKKDSTHRLLYAGLFVISLSTFLDYVGTAMGLWYYSGKLTPTFPAWLPFNFCLLPVTIMVLIQTKPGVSRYKKAFIFSFLTSFIGEPIFVWAGFYILTGWHYVYSFPIYAVIYMMADWLANQKTYVELGDETYS